MPRPTHRLPVPAVARSLQTLFLLRTLVSLLLVGAGIACLYFGHLMLLEGLQLGSEALLVEIPGKIKITAGGFGAVVMGASLLPFILAFLARPTLKIEPAGQSASGPVAAARTLGLTPVAI